MDNVHMYYGKSYILQGVSLEAERGKITVLLGRNGAGKTTTLRTILGFVKPRTGKIFLENAEITNKQSFKIARMGIGYVPQGRHLFPRMTVLENLKTGMTNKSDKDALDEVLEIFPIIKDRLHQRAWSLSGGEQQAVAISRALLKKPDILLLDEPTTGLMPLFVSSLREVIRMLNNDGMTILLVEENVPFAMVLADYVYFMVKGKIEYRAEREQLEGKKEIFVRYLGVGV